MSPSDASGAAEAGPDLLVASISDRDSLTVPGEARFGAQAVTLQGGKSYLVAFSLETVKRRDAPGNALYLAVSFRCAGGADRSVASIGGTQNLLPGEPVSLKNQLLVRPSGTGEYKCSVHANSPYDDIAAVGTHLELDAEWRMFELGGPAFEANADTHLPSVLQPDESAYALAVTVPEALHGADTLDVRATLHLTTCTGVNGSREHGRTWCEREHLDLGGSTATAALQVTAIDSRGRVCGKIASVHQEVRITRLRHHQLLHLERLRIPIPAKACGSEFRVTVRLENSGPAALVMHATNSSLSVNASRA